MRRAKFDLVAYPVGIEGGVHFSTLIVHMPLFFVLLEDALFLPGRRPFCDSCCSLWIGRSDKWGGRDAIIFLRQKDDPKVLVFPDSKGTLDQLRILCQ